MHTEIRDWLDNNATAECWCGVEKVVLTNEQDAIMLKLKFGL